MKGKYNIEFQKVDIFNLPSYTIIKAKEYLQQNNKDNRFINIETKVFNEISKMGMFQEGDSYEKIYSSIFVLVHGDWDVDSV